MLSSNQYSGFQYVSQMKFGSKFGPTALSLTLYKQPEVTPKDCRHSTITLMCFCFCFPFFLIFEHRSFNLNRFIKCFFFYNGSEYALHISMCKRMSLCLSSAMHECSKRLQCCLVDMYEPVWFGKDEIDIISEVCKHFTTKLCRKQMCLCGLCGRKKVKF